MQMIVPMRRRRYPSQMMSVSPFFGSQFGAPSMRTDISETDTEYQFNVELPGFTKEDVTAELKDGYLIIGAETKQETEEPTAQESSSSQTGEKKEESSQSWVRRERFYGSCKRSYYVGEDIEEDGISAKFENGLLSVSIPKKIEQPQPEQKKLIDIQG